VQRLVRVAVTFLADAQGPDGDCHNRRSANGKWADRRGTGDWWGRSMWGLGAASRSADDWVKQVSLHCFERGAQQRSSWPRAMAFAALGAADVLDAEPGNRTALSVLADAADVIGRPTDDPAWPWPEARLTYANAVLPDAMIAAGNALGRPQLVGDGLALLGWLLEHETCGGHLSVTPSGGAGPRDAAPRFDQQPIEVAALAEGCARAALTTGDERWARAVADAAAWFMGANDVGCPMWDTSTGGSYDGLRADGPNENQGAESTLALVATFQHAQRLQVVHR
jgi:hypothetical protein